MQRHGKTKNVPKYFRYSTLCSNVHRCAKCFPAMISSTCVKVQIACTFQTWWQNQFQRKGNSFFPCGPRGDDPASLLAWSTDPGAAKHQITSHHPKVPKLIKLAKATCAEPSGRMRKKKSHPARNIFPSQNSQNIPCVKHFWEFKWLEIARRCGAKHVLKSAYLKTW